MNSIAPYRPMVVGIDKGRNIPQNGDKKRIPVRKTASPTWYLKTRQTLNTLTDQLHKEIANDWCYWFESQARSMVSIVFILIIVRRTP